MFPYWSPLFIEFFRDFFTRHVAAASHLPVAIILVALSLSLDAWVDFIFIPHRRTRIFLFMVAFFRFRLKMSNF